MKLTYADITPEAIYLDRRAFMVGAAALLVGGARAEAATPPKPAALKATPNPKFRIDDPPTKYESATTYNNFYEFGTDKSDPAHHAASLRPRPWSVVVDGLVAKPQRLDEALHPLALLTVGMYGKVLPNQNGAPVRVVIPWKYGFKSAKSIVRIRLTEEQPKTAWNKAAPQEYGFYSNVNPDVDHPRWSQATERRIG